jgi:hypothetical protein
MKKKSLVETNPHLRDPEKLRSALVTNVASSTAIETVSPVATIARVLKEDMKAPQFTATKDSAR